ncbi:MAG: AMP phosphorylase [Thermoplasmata archaeon]
MEFVCKYIDLNNGKRTVILNKNDAIKLGVNEENRVIIYGGEISKIFFVNTTDYLVKEGNCLINMDIFKTEMVKIEPLTSLKSTEYIKKKIYGKSLSKIEVDEIIKDIVEDNLSQIELSSYVISLQTVGMNETEISNLVDSMVFTGETIKFDFDVYDVHSIGGVPGNKYALLTVPIAASFGIRIPKTSSRAISSAAGTADVMEVVANVSLKPEDIKRIVNIVGATLAWGGAMKLAPADDKIIKVEQPMGIDPWSQLVASVLSKKKATNIKNLLIDIPMGNETKVENQKDAKELGDLFIKIGNRVGIDINIAITYGGQPLGRTIGPALEAQEALMALEGKHVSNSLVVKSVELASILMEMAGVADINRAKDLAYTAISNGKAREKFFEIVREQGSKNIEKSDDIELGKYEYEYLSNRDGYISKISNRALVKIARSLGAPSSKKAGIYLNKKIGDKIEKNEMILKLYSESKERLEQTLKLINSLNIYEIEGMVIDHYPKNSRSKISDLTE